MEVFLLQLKISALLDCVICSPYIAWNFWQFVLPAFLTPPDIVSQLLLGLPTYLLFETGLLAARRFKKRA